MIIGEQRLSENSYYENYNSNNDGSHQYEALKRKLSSENENDLSNFSDRYEVVKNCNTNSKMQYVDNSITETYHTYQVEQIHQDGEQSYINLTVMTPSLVHYDKNQLTCHTQQQQQQQTSQEIHTSQEQQNYSNNIQEDHRQHNHQHQQQQQHHQSHNKQTSSTPSNNNVGKYEVRNYQQSGKWM